MDDTTRPAAPGDLPAPSDEPQVDGTAAAQRLAEADTPVSTPASGTAVVNANGTVTYTPTPGFSGTDTFTYTVRDASGRTSEATVVVFVSAEAPNPPTAADDDYDVPADGRLVMAVRVNDVDPDGDALAVVATVSAGTVAGLRYAEAIQASVDTERLPSEA